MKRVLHLSTSGWNEREGIARSIIAIAGRLPWESHLAASRPSGPVFAGLHEVPGASLPRPWSTRLREVIGELRPDVIHVHGGEGVAAIAALLAFARVPIVASVYGRAALPAWGPNPLLTMRDTHSAAVGLGKRVALAAGGLVALRAALRTGVLAAVCTPDQDLVDRLADVGPALLCRGAAVPAVERATWSDQPTIVFAGRAERGRGVDDLLEAFPLVRRRVPAARLRLELLPAPSAHRWLAAADDRISVAVRSLPALEPVFASAQVAAMPFRLAMTITPALVAAEAMSVGLPVVATNVGSLAPLVRPGHNGAIVAPRRPAELAEGLVQVLSEPQRWWQLAAGARQTIAHEWHWDRAAAVVERAYALAELSGSRTTRSTVETGGPR